jgi:predicted Holliday junction resolvase-like endonuclease
MMPFEEFQLFRKILCVCPCCGELVRLSDLRLKTKAEVEKTWLDEYEAENQSLTKKEETFEEEKDKLKEAAIEKGRKAAEKAFYAAICPSLQSLKLSPFDLKPIFHPVDFVAFNGMTSGDEISEILFLTREHKCAPLAPIRTQIKQAIENGKYDWQVARIEETGNITIE